MLLWSIVGLWRLVCIRPASRAASVQAFNCGQRSCDRLTTSKQTAAMVGVICGAEVSDGQCLQGFAARTWRDPARGRRRG